MGNLYSAFKYLEASSSGAPGLRRLRVADTSAELPTGFAEALKRMQLLAPGDRPRAALIHASGEARIHRVDFGWGTVCVKETAAPRSDSGIEARWLRFARDVAGESIPEVLGHEGRLLALEYLQPERYRGWLAQLRRGEISPATAAEAGRLIGRLHSASAHNFAVAQGFGQPGAFRAGCIDPLASAAAQAQPALAGRLEAVADALSGKIALVHGDFVPSNVLVGPRGPVLLDADRACYGDPAFDAASCLARLLVLSLAQPDGRERLLLCFDAFCAAYAQRITWEMPEETEQRTALAIPIVLLGELRREDPRELPLGSRESELIDAFARKLLLEPVWRPAAVRETWRRFLLE